MATTLGQPGDDAQKRNSFSMSAWIKTLGVKQWDWATLLPYILASGLLAALAWRMLTWWRWEFTKPESYYAHAPIIPFLVALMLWHRRGALRAAPKPPAFAALFLLIPALAVLVYALKLELVAIESLTFLIVIWSSVWLALGTRFLRAAAFPLGFLILMAPLPGPLLNDATLHIQMLSTVFANKLLHLMTFSTTLVGNDIKMEDYDMFVDVPCSGFKLLLSYITFGAAFTYLLDGAPRKRYLLFFLCLPLALLVNAVRIALIGVVGECISADAAHTFHDWSGILTLILGFSALFGLAKGFGCRTFAGWAIF